MDLFSLFSVCRGTFFFSVILFSFCFFFRFPEQLNALHPVAEGDVQYKTKYKSIWSNLKNYVHNSQLGEKLLTGALLAAKIVTMTPQEMASEEMRKSRQEKVNAYLEENVVIKR